jgi:hypothetical protein
MGVGFGVGGAGLIVGAITGAITLWKANTIRMHCNGNQCTADQQDPIASATALANVSNVFLPLGAVGLAVGVTGVILRPHQPRREGGYPIVTGVTIAPVVGPGVLGLRGSF